MHKSLVALLLAAFAVPALPATELMATVIPPIGLAPGSQYQLIFVTADTTTALSSHIDDYNAFVTAESALNPSLPTGVTWHAVASTADGTKANVNAPSIGLPLYNTQGIEVASAATGLYTPTLLNPIAFDQYGNSLPNPPADDGTALDAWVWTGSTTSGTNFSNATLGSDPVIFGGRDETNSNWITLAGQNPNAFPMTKSLYALSDTLTVPTPEPATLTLLGIGFLVLGGRCFLRWRRSPTHSSARAALLICAPLPRLPFNPWRN